MNAYVIARFNVIFKILICQKEVLAQILTLCDFFCGFTTVQVFFHIFFFSWLDECECLFIFKVPTKKHTFLTIFLHSHSLLRESFTWFCPIIPPPPQEKIK